MSSDINQVTTHDLWVESRLISLTTTRDSPTSMKVTIQHPSTFTVVDGLVVMVSSAPFSVSQRPVDGTKYVASTVLGDAAASSIYGAQVVAFWSSLTEPLPSVVNADGTTAEISFIVEGLHPGSPYYATVHGVSNVLQYYPFGIQSYPLDASRIEKATDSVYIGNIPQLPSAPTNPTSGFVYFDTGMEMVQYWDSQRGIWLPTRMDTILSGPVNPGVSGQCYLVNGVEIKAFNGKEFVKLDETNSVVKVSGAFIPFTKASSGITEPTNPVDGEFFYSFTTARLSVYDTGVWVPVVMGAALLQSNGGMIQLFTTPFTVEPDDLVNPYNGLLFYNTKHRELNSFDGTKWVKVNTDQEGVSMSDKTPIGTDGSYDDRQRLIKVLKLQLGWPTQCVELTEEHFNVGIDNALDTYRQLCSHAYERRFIMYQLYKNQQAYLLNSPVDGTDRVVSIVKINRLNTFGLTNSNTWDSNVFMQTFMSAFYSTATVDLLSVHLMSNLHEEMNRVFAGDYVFTWNEAKREMNIARRVAQNEKVVLEVFFEKTEQELLMDRFAKQFLQGWAMAECKEMLGWIRSKFQSGTPGASGNITLNGEMLLNEARQDFTEWKEALLNWEHMSGEMGNVSFLIG